MCGELCPSALILSSSPGSSPRVRGTLVFSRRGLPSCTVHPRVCGELSTSLIPDPADTGSSPRVRGTRCVVMRVARSPRFIPACAGNSAPVVVVVAESTVHPRVCGELVSDLAARGGWDGSSPRVRGTRHLRDDAPRRVRFIPACAGNSQRGTKWSTTTTVHPRVCGELSLNELILVVWFGSSPRVRGTRQLGRLAVPDQRFIPACAGNSSTTPEPPMLKYGSSPRVRGTQLDRQSAQHARRFIPACAGNSNKIVF